ncbi:MAG: E2 domain-containing protein [Asticcacaulis sp.]|uniref:E2 domain-containing protein n=1 Tax=Asticcacaulis sp. TaxID=1872648 RepID=UPI003F7C2DAF
MKSHSLSKIQGVAYPASTIWVSSGISLTITGKVTSIAVTETTPGMILPSFCPERHINGDSSFCLGLKPVRPDDPNSAALWWLHLLQYLQCQSTAAKVGIWSM